MRFGLVHFIRDVGRFLMLNSWWFTFTVLHVDFTCRGVFPRSLDF